MGYRGLELVKRFDVWLTPLDPTVGSELRKTRPCIVVSPDETNRHLHTVVVVPLTTAEHAYAFRLDLPFAGRQAQAAIDQVRVIDRGRLLTCLGSVDDEVGEQLLVSLRTFFT